MEKINIAELLRNCPNSMELDCTMYEDVYFDYVDELNIIHCYIKNKGFKTSITFNQHGTPNSDIKSKCVIFPKGKTTWEGFAPPCQFKDGDIVVTTLGNIAIIRKPIGEELFYIYGLMVGNGFYKDETAKVVVERPATEEEKQKLFKSIKDNGYKWNAETKTLEELPKFKEIHFYKDYKDLQDVTVIAVCHNYAINAIKNDEPIIHTTAITALDMTGLLDRGYKIYLHENGRVGELHLGTTSLTDKELRKGHNISNIWIGGGFEDFFYH